MSFKKRYRDLEMEVFATLGEIISNSDYEPENYSAQAIQINVEHFIEIANIGGTLKLLDEHGYQYSIFATSLENLIDIVEKHLDN